MKDLHNKVAFITGAAGGIGRSCAIELATRGCDIVIADLNLLGAEQTKKEVRLLGREALVIKLDVACEHSFVDAVDEAIKWKGNVDILINNAGFMVGGSVAETSMKEWHKLNSVNIYGAIHGVKAVQKHMQERGSGHIVNVASLFGFMHVPFVSAYCMTKAAILAFSASLRAELTPFGIGVTCVCPGSVETGLIDNGIWSSSKGGNFIPDMFSQNFKSTPEQIAKATANGISKNKRLVLAGKDAKILGPLLRFFPGLFAWSFAKVGKDLA